MTPAARYRAARYRAACAALGMRVWQQGMPALDWMQFWSPGSQPDLASPAGTGCLLAVAREVWQAPYMHVVWMGNTPAGPSTSSWWSAWIDCRVVGHGPTEADALIAALEAAARRGGQP
jgi:hypothetical protein